MIDTTYAIDVNAIEQAFITLISGSLEILAIKAEQSNQTVPTGQDFATVHLYSMMTVGYPNIRYAAATVDCTEEICDDSRFSVSINIFRDSKQDAIRAAEILKAYLRTTQANQILDTVNVGIIRFGETRNLSEVIKTEWESRAQFDIEAYSTNCIATTVSAVEAQSITGTFEDQSEVYPISVEVAP